MAYPSIWLAGLYDGKKYYGQSISAIKKEIIAVIKDVMRRIASEHNLSQGNMGAKQLISLLDYMDDSILEYENAEIQNVFRVMMTLILLSILQSDLRQYVCIAI